MIHRAALALALAACTQTHDPSRIEVGSAAACEACHLVDFDAGTAFHTSCNAAGKGCAACHVSTTLWTSAAGCGHPEQAFPIARAPHSVPCAQCHDLAIGSTYSGGANTNCVACHPRSTADPQHNGVPDYATTDKTAANYCLTCHPSGEAAGHPDDRFPIASGPHRVVECTSCHDSRLGTRNSADNTNCVGCHTGEHAEAKVNAQHREVRDYTFDPANPHFCLRCHPRGRTD